MYEYEDTNDDLPEEDAVDDSVPAGTDEPVAESEPEVEGVVYERLPNGQLVRN